MSSCKPGLCRLKQAPGAPQGVMFCAHCGSYFKTQRLNPNNFNFWVLLLSLAGAFFVLSNLSEQQTPATFSPTSENLSRPQQRTN